jgi:hypothetical protein
MAQNSPSLPAGESLVMKAVSAVAAILALFVYSTALFLPNWDARGMSFSIGTLILGVAAGLFAYAVRPVWFSGKDRVIEDPWRTQYHVPEVQAAEAPAINRAAIPSNAKRFFGVTEHIYAWQQVDRVLPGERVWTPVYIRRVLLQLVAVVSAGALTVLGALGLALVLANSESGLYFIAASVVLYVAFGLGLRGFVADSEKHPTVPMTPTFDANWRPGLGETAPATVPGPHEVHAA